MKNIKIFNCEYSGGGCYLCDGEVENYTFIGNDEGIEYFDKSLNITLDYYLNNDAYELEQKYAIYSLDEETDKQVLCAINKKIEKERGN